MSTAWEVTVEDIGLVLAAHKIPASQEFLEELLDELDCDAIENGVLYYTSMQAQIDSSLDDIENQLMELGHIPNTNKKLFFMAAEYEEEEEDFNDFEEELESELADEEYGVDEDG